MGIGMDMHESLICPRSPKTITIVVTDHTKASTGKSCYSQATMHMEKHKRAVSTIYMRHTSH